MGKQTNARSLALHDLNYLLSFPKLGEWGMETLIETLHVLLPELKDMPPPDRR